MSPDELEAIATMIYGPQWQTPLAEFLGVSDRLVRYWITEERSIPDDIASKLMRAIDGKRVSLHYAANDLVMILGRRRYQEQASEPAPESVDASLQ